MAREILGGDGFLYYKSDHAGSLKGESWDDHAGGEVKHIAICYGSDAIRSIQTTYFRGGNAVMSRWHGGKHGNFELINLVEPLTWVRGHYGSLLVPEDLDPCNDEKVITSLTFGTDKTKHGPFGREEGEPFSFKAAGTGISGFYGHSTNDDRGYLHAIGVYVRCPAARFIDQPQEPEPKYVSSDRLFGTSSFGSSSSPSSSSISSSFPFGSPKQYK